MMQTYNILSAFFNFFYAVKVIVAQNIRQPLISLDNQEGGN
ncbi:hypothetical protein Oscil6304_1275 [Oscillatoria acuminata PCC 6304]|uniref:Uncharacterized protein n=1 Tax=Oscillatoria acuminata PCC 6304 TaxID=56110 RepID=K9TG34_9CYAN|nr:hypothetical protein Oscil6304_1275 [Oscillatoria acuminata PCC 6304]